MNKTFRSVWNARKQTYVAAAESVSARGKPCSGTQLIAALAAALGVVVPNAQAQTAPPVDALPSGGQVSAGQAAIHQSGANMVIRQGSDRAAINWQTFNVGQNAHVQFQQPGASSVTLNRVMSSDPSQIFGRISANGQVILTNPSGVYFGRSAKVDVGGLVATTHQISDDDFMAGNNRYERKDSTGSVINEGELKAALGGYIALLAPEVRNQGAIIAQMGTVALAAGEAIDLHFDSNNRLTSIRVEPAQIQTLVDNRHAVEAPGGLVIISAQSMDRLVGGVVKNSGRIEATGLQQQGGRIILSASTKVENTGLVSADATDGPTPAESGPAGEIEIAAPEVVNAGTISASGVGKYAGGKVRIEAARVEQKAQGSVRAEAPVQGGRIEILASDQVQVEGVLSVAGPEPVAASTEAVAVAAEAETPEPGAGGFINIEAAQITLNTAMIDASGRIGGTVRVHASGRDAAPTAPEQPSDPREPGRLAILGNSAISVRGRSAQGGSATLTGDEIGLLDNTRIDATGASGGGTVLVGGGWQGAGDTYQATKVSMAEDAHIDVSATRLGDGGTVVLWSDIHNTNSETNVQGGVQARAGEQGGNGGRVETSGHGVKIDGFSLDTLAAQGQAGLWLIDPYDYVIGSSQASTIGNALNTSNVTVTTSSNVTNYGSNGNLNSNGDIFVNSAITKTGAAETTLTLQAARHIALASSAHITSTSGKLHVNFYADADYSGDGINQIASDIKTNGG